MQSILMSGAKKTKSQREKDKKNENRDGRFDSPAARRAARVRQLRREEFDPAFNRIINILGDDLEKIARKAPNGVKIEIHNGIVAISRRITRDGSELDFGDSVEYKNNGAGQMSLFHTEDRCRCSECIRKGS